MERIRGFSSLFLRLALGLSFLSAVADRFGLPLILGSDLSGVVEAIGPGVTNFMAGDEVYGVRVRGLGAHTAIDYRETLFEEVVRAVDVVLDTVGGETRVRSIGVLNRGGILVSVVSSPMPEDVAANAGVKAVYFIVDVTTDRLNTIAELFDSKKLVPQVGTVLPLADAQVAHQMLAGAPHRRGKIVLSVAA